VLPAEVIHMLAALLAAALAAVPVPPAAPPPFKPARPAAVEDEDLTAAAQAHPISLARVEAYARAVKALREAAAQDPAVRRPFRSRDRFTSIAESARRLEAVPQVKAILDRHGVTGRDFVLTPTVVLAGRAAVMAEQGGHPAPAPARDSAAVALWREQGPRLEALVTGFMGDLQALAAP
jgi:hypothetical protein